MSRYLTLRINIPTLNTVYATEFRKKLAALNARAPDGEKIHPGIFHYADSGQTLNSRAGIRFGGGKALRLHALGEDASSLLRQERFKIIQLLERALGVDLNFECSGGTCAVTVEEYLISYRVPCLIYQTKPRHYRELCDMSKEQHEAWILKLLTKTLNTELQQAELQDLNEIPEFVIGNVKIVGKTLPIEVKPGVFQLGATNVTFETNLRWTGPIRLGAQIAKGYGEVHRADGVELKSSAWGFKPHGKKSDGGTNA